MITWLNKQLNEKPGIGGSLMPSTASKYGGTTMSKPPTAMGSTGFKPSFGSIEQLNGGYVAGRTTSIERSPSYRAPNLPSAASSILGMNTPTSSSMSSSITASLAQSSTLNVRTQQKHSDAPKAFSYASQTAAMATGGAGNKENANTLNMQPHP